MLGFIKKIKKAPSISGWCVGMLFIATFFAIYPVGAELVERIVAVVNDDIILLSELKEAALSSKLSNTPPEENKALINQLIDEKLTLQQISSLGLKVSEEQITATIERIKEINKLSDQEMLNMITLDGMTLEAFKKNIKNQLLRNRLIDLEVKSKIVITNEDVEAYYSANKQLYTGKVRYHLRQLLITVDSNASDDEKNQKYKKIRDLYDRLEEGENFADLASVYSQAPTAANGGDLGFFELRLLAPQIRNALKDLEAGQFSDIIETDYGYQLFYVEEIENAGGKSLEDVSESIEEKLYSERMEEKFKLWLADLRSKAHIRIIE